MTAAPALATLPAIRGQYTENAPLGEASWFRCGGRAEVLFRPADADDLAAFLAGCPPAVPVTVLQGRYTSSVICTCSMLIPAAWARSTLH